MAALLRRAVASLTHQSSSSFAARSTNAMSGLQILGMGNPLLDISAVVDANLLEKYGVSTRPPLSGALADARRFEIA
jgi:hypothetical protein